MASRSVMDTPSFPVKNTYLDTQIASFNGIVQPVPGRSIKVLALAIISREANEVYFTTGPYSRISATMPLGNNGGYVLPYNPYGWFKTNEGEALAITLSVATDTGIMVSYIED